MVKAFPTRHLSLEEMRRVERSVVDRAGALACWRGAQPDPHLFLAAARGLGVDQAHCFVVGDRVWDRSPHSGPVPWARSSARRSPTRALARGVRARFQRHGGHALECGVAPCVDGVL